MTRNQQSQKTPIFKCLHFGEGKQWSEVLMEKFLTLKMKKQNPAIKFQLGRSISLWLISFLRSFVNDSNKQNYDDSC